MKDGTIGVLVVEDDDDFCFLIGDTLGREPDMRILGSTASGEEAVYLAQRLDPDIVLMDLNLSLEELDGIEAARKIRLYTRAKVILVTAFEAQSIVIDACKRSFASSYVFKSQFSILTETVRQTAEGPTPPGVSDCFPDFGRPFASGAIGLPDDAGEGRPLAVLPKDHCEPEDRASQKAGIKKPERVGAPFSRDAGIE